MITYGYQQQLYKLKPLQIIVLAFLTCCDFILLWSFVASIVFEKWIDFAWTIALIAASIGCKIATTFCMEKICYKFCNHTLEVRKVFPYLNKLIVKCQSSDIKKMEMVFQFSERRIESENGKNKLSKMQNNAVKDYVASHNIVAYSKAFVASCAQDIYMMECCNEKIFFVAIDEFMKSLLDNYEEKI